MSSEIEIRPFRVEFPAAEIADLRRRIAATRWPERETVTDDSQGVRLALMQDLARYWGTDYDWRACEAKLNAQPNFITEIDGLDIHFIHVRSPHEDALPLIVTHGWPGSVQRGDAPPADLSPEEKNAYEQLRNFYAKHVAYAQILTTRPQTLYGLADSPADLAAFMLDHGDGTGQPGLVELALQGQLQSALTRDDLLDNITLYWLTNTGVSSGRLYWENKADFFDAKNITIPFAISVFPDELYQAPRSWAERAYPHNLIHYKRLDRGGHFAAWEQPDLFSAEMRDSFRTLR
jgi:hypothetical protein